MRSFRDYLQYADKYLGRAEDVVNRGEDAEWLLIPAIILAWSSIECFVNNRFSDLGYLPPEMFALHERSFLLEKRLRFVDSGVNIGKFVIEGNEYQALENKIFFLLAKLGSQDTTDVKGGALWQRFQNFKDARDSLIHPRKDVELTVSIEDARTYINTAKEVIQLISERIWNTRLDI